VRRFRQPFATTPRWETAETLVAFFFFLVLGWFVLSRWRARGGNERAAKVTRRSQAVAVGLIALASVAGIASAVVITQVGHSGATSVWQKELP
jgi:hypothetical protein